jgi:hypothetical protein
MTVNLGFVFTTHSNANDSTVSYIYRDIHVTHK